MKKEKIQKSKNPKKSEKKIKKSEKIKKPEKNKKNLKKKMRFKDLNLCHFFSELFARREWSYCNVRSGPLSHLQTLVHSKIRHQPSRLLVTTFDPLMLQTTYK